MKKFLLSLVIAFLIFTSCTNEKFYRLSCVLPSGKIVDVDYAQTKQMVPDLKKGQKVTLKRIFNSTGYVFLGTEQCSDSNCIIATVDTVIVLQ